ncbi:12265_t:CDS:1, partial [Cetraspora pellucida]
YKHKRLAIDGSIYLRKFVYGIKATNNQGEVHPYTHILGFYRMTVLLKQNNITPIFVFDGKTRIKEKSKELIRRRNLAKKTLEVLKFEEIRNERIEKWKSVVNKMEKMKDNSASEYITMGLSKVVEETISSSMIKSLDNSTHIHLNIPQNIISLTTTRAIETLTGKILQDLMKFIQLEQNTDFVDSYFEKSCIEGSDKLIKEIRSLKGDKSRYIRQKVILELQIPILIYLMKFIRQVVEPQSHNMKVMQKQQTQLIRLLLLIKEIATKSQARKTSSVERVKTIANLTDEQVFKKKYPNFKPSSNEIKLKKKIKDMVNTALKDVVSLANDKRFTKVQRGIMQMEYQLVESLLAGQLSNDIILDIEAESNSLMKSLGKRTIKVTWKMYDECQEFLKAWGIPCITSEGYEAEALCASLTTHGLADASVSDDTDTILYGDGPVVRQFLTKKNPIQEVSPNKIRELLNLSRDEFIDLCILCGTDFSGTIQGIGPTKALKMIRSYGTIENIISKLDSYNTYESDFMEEVKSARRIFKSPPIISSKYKKMLEEKEENAEFPKLLNQFQIDTNDKHNMKR